MKCRTILLVLIVIHLIGYIVKADELEEEAEDSGKVERQKKQKGCKNLWGKRPKWYKKGRSVIKGCYKFTCTSPKPRRYEWVQELARTKCCSFNESFVAIGSTLLTKVLPNECTTTFLRCKKKEVFAELELEVEDECPEPPGIMNVVTVPEETIQSARYPSPFPEDQDECWMRTPSCGHHVHIKFEHFDVLGKDAFLTIHPPISGRSKFYGNEHNNKHVPPKSIDFPQDTAVKVCFYSGAVVSGHKGFQARVTERENNHYVTSPNYPEDINDETYMDPPPHGYGPHIHHCTVRAPSKGRALHMEFHRFDVNAPPERYGDWVTIYPNPTDREKYYGVSLNQNTAPPRHHLYLIDDIVTICFKTRSSVDDHEGYVADIYEDYDPTTVDSYTSYNTYYDYTNYDYTYYRK